MCEEDDVLKGKTKIVLNIISINVYFGYNFKFFVIKIISIHDCFIFFFCIQS